MQHAQQVPEWQMRQHRGILHLWMQQRICQVLERPMRRWHACTSFCAHMIRLHNGTIQTCLFASMIKSGSAITKQRYFPAAEPRNGAATASGLYVRMQIITLPLHHPTRTDVDECRDSRSCPNGGCVNTAGSFRCQLCSPGFRPADDRCVGKAIPHTAIAQQHGHHCSHSSGCFRPPHRYSLGFPPHRHWLSVLGHFYAYKAAAVSCSATNCTVNDFLTAYDAVQFPKRCNMSARQGDARCCCVQRVVK